MKKIIVTGGAGFIGSHTVVELHEAGYTPIIVDNFSNSEESVIGRLEEIIDTSVICYNVDCNDRKAMQEIFAQEKDIAGVIHFAADKAVGESVQKPTKYFYNNIASLAIILDVMEEYKVKNLVFSSSCTVYGQPESIPVTEQSPIKQAESPYGYTKQACERLLFDQSNTQKGNNSIILRYFNPIGAHASSLIGELPIGVPNNLVPFITQTAAGIRKELSVFGDDYSTKDGTCVRDYIHVVDLAKAHVSSIKWLQNQSTDNLCEVFNVGTGKGNSVLEVVNTFMEVNNVKLKHKIGPRRSGDVEQIFANADKSNSFLNWKPELSLKDALKDAWNWQLSLKNQK